MDVLLAVYVQPESPRLCIILPGLSRLELGVPCAGPEAPAPGEEGSAKLHFLSGLSSAADVSYWVFPLQLIKSLTEWGKASSVLFGFKYSYQLRFR